MVSVVAAVVVVTASVDTGTVASGSPLRPQPASASAKSNPAANLMDSLSSTNSASANLLRVLPSVLYFHGFASSPRSTKLVALQKVMAADVAFDAPDLNVPSFEKLEFEAMVRLGVEHGRRTPPRAVVGSSLGAMVALEVVRRGVEAPLILVAPAIGVGDRWKTRIGDADPVEVFHHGRNANASVHRRFYDEMCSVRPDEAAPPVPVSVIMGRLDESVPFVIVRTRWEEWTESSRLITGSRFIEIAGGDHGLTGWVDIIAREIKAAVFHAF